MERLRDRGNAQSSNHTLKKEITELLASGNFGSRGLMLDDNDVLPLLRAAIEQEGSISAFARRHGLERNER